MKEAQQRRVEGPPPQQSGRPELLRRTRNVIWVLQAMLVVLVARAALLQLDCDPSEATKHRKNTVSLESEEARRGSVRTRDGVILAHDVTAWAIGIDPIVIESTVRARWEQALEDKKARDEGKPRKRPRRTYWTEKELQLGWQELTNRAIGAALASFPVDLLSRTQGFEQARLRALRIVNARDLIEYDDDGRVTNDARHRYVALGEIHEPGDHERLESWRWLWRRDTGLRGFSVRSFLRRDYPLGTAGRQLVGTVSRGNKREGLWGLEQSCDSVLAGFAGRRELPRAASKKLASMSIDRDVPTVSGSDLQLTIDSRVQRLLESELERTHIEWSAERTLGMVLDPRTGAVLAAASTPLYDTSVFVGLGEKERKDEHARRQQQLLAYQFEPGSTVKPFFLGEVYYRGLDPRTLVTDGRREKKVGGVRWVKDSSDHPALSIEGAVIHSSNIGLAQTGLMLGKRRVRQCLARFRFGLPTEIPLSKWEWEGAYSSAQDWTAYSTATVPFGYEIMVTLPQLAQAYCAILNDGKMVRPHLVQTIDGVPAEQVSGRLGPTFLGNVYEGGRGVEISRRVRKVLREAAVRGTGRRLHGAEYGPEIEWGGKSGTSRIYKAGEGYTEEYCSSYVGFAPTSAPRCLALVVVVKPQGMHYGATISGPVVRRLLGAVLGEPDPQREESADQLVRSAAAPGYSGGRR